jgi:hypothetical protein
MSATVRRAREIAAELQKSEAWRARGEVLLTVASAILAAIPGMGPAAAAADKIGSKLLDGDLEHRFQELCAVVAVLEPGFDRIESLEERVAELGRLVTTHAALATHTAALAAALTDRVDEVRVTTANGSTQSFADILINNMRLVAEARGNSANTFDNTHIVGPAHFYADNQSHQDVSRSTFSAPIGGQIEVDGARLRGGIHFEPGQAGDGRQLQAGDEIGRISFVGRPGLRSGDTVGSMEFVSPQTGRVVAAITAVRVAPPAQPSKPPKPDGSGFWVDKLGRPK